MNFRRALELMNTAASNAGNAKIIDFVCPLCLERQKQPTVEHVPAKSLGGHALTLTCKECNQHAGRTLQPNQRNAARAEFTINGAEAHGQWSPNIAKIRIELDQNAPAIARYFQENETTGRPLKVEDFEEPKWRLSRLADARDAYLYAFAKYGYSLVARPHFAWLRTAFQAEKTINKRFALATPHLSDGFYVLQQPAEALLVVRSARATLLPTESCPNPYEALAPDRPTLTFAGHAPILLPTEMELAWDFALPPKSEALH